MNDESVGRRRRRTFFLIRESLLMDLKSYVGKNEGGVSSSIGGVILGTTAAAIGIVAATKLFKGLQVEKAPGYSAKKRAQQESEAEDEKGSSKIKADEDGDNLSNDALIEPDEIDKDEKVEESDKPSTEPKPEPAQREPVKQERKPQETRAIAPEPKQAAGAPEKPEIEAKRLKITPADRYTFEKPKLKPSVVAEASQKLGNVGYTLTSQSKSGPRHKFQFFGFPGADKISQYGSYTEAEAKKIVELKSNKVPTGAGKGPLPPDLVAKAEFYARKHKVSEDYMLQVMKMESGGNPNAISFTGAIGPYQFVGVTATSVGIEDRFNPDQNIEGGAILAKMNEQQLKNRGLTSSPLALYLVHQLGPSAAAEVLRNSGKGVKIESLSEGTKSALSKNAFGNSLYVSEYLDKTRSKLSFQTNVVPTTAVATTLPPSDKKKSAPEAVTAKQSHQPTGVVPQPTVGNSAPQGFARTSNGIVVAL